MRRIKVPSLSLLSFLLLITVSACTSSIGSVSVAPSSLPQTRPAAPGTFSDPFDYCAAVGTVDKPVAPYVGTAVPDAIINGFKKAAGLEASTEPLEMLRQSTIWRCMGGKVYACNFGANLPCDSKANTDRTPSPGMKDYCEANPGSDVIPMSVTGHDTIYSWHCVKNTPQFLQQIGQVDAAGYLSQIWYPIAPGHK